MNRRCPTVTLTPEESAVVRNVVRLHGIVLATRMLGNVDQRTLLKAAAETPIARLTALVIRGSLDRI